MLYHEGMKKEYLLVIVLSVVIVILLAVLIWLPVKKAVKNKGFYGNENEIQVLMLEPNAKISSPITIRGKVYGNGWNGFEGQVGTVSLYNGEGTIILTEILTATTDWMKLPTAFETTLDFSGYEGPATLVFKNENPSGEPSRDKTFSVPVIIVSSGETMNVKAFFGDGKLNVALNCTEVSAVERIVPKTTAVARTALEELLKGLTQAEKDKNFYTSINAGVKIQSLVIDNAGTAKVDFNEQLQFQVGGSCRVAAIRAQITKTLLQFPTIKNVIISINGRTEDILQP
jgi:hypothetical protein